MFLHSRIRRFLRPGLPNRPEQSFEFVTNVAG